jgi:hypothetical protein
VNWLGFLEYLCIAFQWFGFLSDYACPIYY